MLRIYGIKNCDNVKKALKILSEKSIDYELIDFKKTPPTKKLLKEWKKFLGDLPVNKRGTTYRKIKESYENASLEEQILILIENPSAIMRPIFEKSNLVIAIKPKSEFYSSL